MNLQQRFSLLVKGRLDALFDALEDPERSLYQLVLDMEEELEAAKRAVAGAMANEDALRRRVAIQDKEAGRWREAAETFLSRDREAKAREALRREERALRQRERLAEQLSVQEQESADIRESIARMNARVEEARSRHQLLQARMRQGQARASVNRVMRRVESRNLHADFDRLGDRLESRASAEAAYQRIDDELRGEDLRRGRENLAEEEAVERRMAELKRRRQTGRKGSPDNSEETS